jgi:hypothetical protein
MFAEVAWVRIILRRGPGPRRGPGSVGPVPDAVNLQARTARCRESASMVLVLLC